MKSNEKESQLTPRPYLLKNKIQHYAWGTRGKNAFIPKFLGTEGVDNKPYAELWIGAHPNAPSEVFLDGSYIPLNELISQHPVEILGEVVSKKFSGKLPFLFKIISAGEALSIQAHPNKEQAISLHARDAVHYPDDNHKPEVAIALTSLTALVGFKPFPELVQTLRVYPEIADFIGHDLAEKFQNISKPSTEEIRTLVKLIFSTLMNQSITNKNKLIEAIEQLEQRLNKATSPLKEAEKLFLNLKKKYGIDVGLFSIFLLNLVHFKKKQAIFLAAGIPHAYIEGNIVECMANSDNVVRAGLTPKFKDIQTLVDILTYDTNPISVLGKNFERDELVYKIPVQEFQVTHWQLKTFQEKVEKTGQKLKILLIIEGKISISWNTGIESEQQEFHQGQSILIPAILDEFIIKTLSPVIMFKVDVP